MNEEFNKDFIRAIELINSTRNINEIEKVADIFVLSTTSEINFMNFQVQMLSLLGPENTPVILHFLKSDINIHIEDKNLRKTYALLNKIRFLIKDKLQLTEQSISNPFKLYGQMFTFSEEFPYHLTSTLTRADGESIKFLMNINDGLLLMHSLSMNFEEKFSKGANNIDRNMYFEFKKAVRKLEEKIDNLIIKEDQTNE